AALPQVKGDSRPPQILDHVIEMMFPFAALGRFNFDAGLLPIQSIDNTKNESSQDSEPDAANRKGRCRAASDYEARDRNLVWRDSRLAKKRDNSRFDRRMQIRRQVECS